MIYDIIVIGAGASGMTAALYALRSGKTVLMIEQSGVGGQIADSPKVENFPTLPEISGSDFADKFFEQVTAWGAELEYDRVCEVVKEGEGDFTVKTEYGEYKSRAVIAATGVKHRHLRVPGEEDLIGKGVYFCALCDGPFYKDKEVALIGDGNTAMQYALILSGICSKVWLLTLTERFFGDKILEKRIAEKTNIIHLSNTSVTAFNGSDTLESIEYVKTDSGEKATLKVPAAFVSIGQIPDNGLFASLARIDEKGYFEYSGDGTTATAGFFVAGDCRAKKVRQLTTAVSDGAVAAVSACEYIDKL